MNNQFIPAPLSLQVHKVERQNSPLLDLWRWWRPAHRPAKTDGPASGWWMGGCMWVFRGCGQSWWSGCWWPGLLGSRYHRQWTPAVRIKGRVIKLKGCWIDKTWQNSAIAEWMNDWMNENLYTAHTQKDCHTKPCVLIAPEPLAPIHNHPRILSKIFSKVRCSWVRSLPACKCKGKHFRKSGPMEGLVSHLGGLSLQVTQCLQEDG